MIKVLSKETIDKIAAGEVIERPSSVVKELVENSIDAGSTAVTVEIKGGGIELIRVTDNGHGIECAEVRTAFLRHATGKITDADDLMTIHSLGFRGEALSSIAAVTRTEIITKTPDNITAVRYRIEGGEEICYEEVGAPDGTTIIARDLFYNVPARRKFLKTASTEGSHVAELMEKMALSHPDISFRFINNGQVKLYTSGNGSLKDIVYQIYGRDITTSLIDVEQTSEKLKIKGIVAKPEVSRPNRNFETYYINGRYIKSSVISKAIEDAYEERMMQHQFPFAVLIIEVDPEKVDVNVHPTKMEVRFSKPYEVYDEINKAVKDSLNSSVLIPHSNILPEEKSGNRSNDNVSQGRMPEPVKSAEQVRPAEPFETKRQDVTRDSLPRYTGNYDDVNNETSSIKDVVAQNRDEQLTFTAERIRQNSGPQFRLVGQVFDTYWIIELENKMYLMDQHAAHEKIYYERLLKQSHNNSVTSQLLDPPVIITLTDLESDAVIRSMEDFSRAGYEIEHFGGNEYAIRAIPGELPSINKAELLKEMIAEYSQEKGSVKQEMLGAILRKTASMACKAAIKGGERISFAEANMLIKELLLCDNPYCCPHGRPTMIEFSKSDLEKRFKRII